MTYKDHELDSCELVGKNNDWKILLASIVKNHHLKKPEEIYNEFIKNVLDEHSITIDSLPTKKQIKAKISSLKTTVKKQVQRSFV